MTQLICNPCKKPLSGQQGAVQFPCPQCGKYVIVRCKHCREISAKYQCPACTFEGPN